MVQFGIDQLLLSTPSWKKSRIGLVTNAAAVNIQGIPTRKLLLEEGYHLVQLFSPEHGLSAKGADGVAVKDGIDELTQLNITSLYGEKIAPTTDDLAEIDLILFDIPDSGVRFYTYLWTLTYVMEACAAAGKKMIILDRPNPISGNLELAEGPLLDEACASFIGRWSIPVRHSCTLGELALYFNTTQHIHADLEVIPCANWNRLSFQPDWGTPFVPTSPAIQAFESMMLYPGLCLLEATNLNEGRGTDFAFQVLGAPWLKYSSLAAQLNSLMGEEIEAEAIQYIPANAKYAGQSCNGIRFSVKDFTSFKPVFWGMLLVRLIKDAHPEDFNWDIYATNVNPSGENHLDKITGIAGSLAFFELPFAQFLRKLTMYTNVPDWTQETEGYLLY